VNVINSKTHYTSVFLALATTLGLLVIFVASTFIFTSNNPVAKLAMLVGAMLFLIGTIEPRRMLVVLVPVTFYLDGIKRLLILLGRTDIEDVTSILAIAPMATLGILIGCVIRRIFFRRRGEVVERLAIIGALAAFVAFGGMETFTAGNLLFGLKYAANTTVYFLLPWAVLQLYRTQEEIERFLKYCLIVGIPVALYGIWQFAMGLNEFEIAYLKSGLSMVGEQNLDDIRPRPFATLSSNHPYSFVMMFMLALSGHFVTSWARNRRSWKGVLVMAIYAVAVALSMARSAIISGIALFVFPKLFRSKSGTVLAYSVSAGLLGVLVLFAQQFLDSLDMLQAYLPTDSIWQEQAFRIGTTSDRFKGFTNVLTNTAAWPLIANPIKYNHTDQSYTDADYHHDLFSAMILRVGIIPVFLGACLTLFILWRAHRAILRLPEAESGRRSLAARLMAIVMVFLLSQSSGSGITVFPINFWVGMFVGFISVVCLTVRNKKPVPATSGDIEAAVAARAGAR